MPIVPAGRFPPPWRHAVCALLAPGSVILPGNMGRIVGLYVAGTDRPAQEAIYERARTVLQPTAPSRLACTFVCPTIEDAVEFAMTGAPRMNQWYAVEPVEPTPELFVATQTAWGMPTHAAKPWKESDFTAICEEYWNGPAEHHREILYPGPLRVLSIDPINDMCERLGREGRLIQTGGKVFLDDRPIG